MSESVAIQPDCIFDVAKNIENTRLTIKEQMSVTPEDMEKLSLAMSNVLHSHTSAQVFRTPTEMRVSVLGDLKCPTPDSKYWQALREMKVMSDQLFLLNFDYRTKLIDREELIEKLQTATGYDKQRKDIELEKLEYELQQMSRVAKDRIREISEWDKIIKQLATQLSCSADNVDDHQLISLAVKFINDYMSMVGNKASVSKSESFNLMNLLVSTINEIKRRGMFDGFMSFINDETKQFLSQRGLL